MLLALATMVVYLPALNNGFVNYDDPDYVTANPEVRAGLTVKGVAWAFSSGHADNWHPLTWLSHMLDCELFGPHPVPAHAVNVAFHAANAVLLFLWLNAITGFAGRSWLVAALFALHPLHVESVAWVAERKDVLSTFFFLLTLLAYCRYAGSVVIEGGCARRADRGPAPFPRQRLLYSVAVVAFALGLLSKPMLVTTPFVLLLLDFWPLGRITPGGAGRPGVLRRLILEKVPFVLLSIVASVVTLIVQQRGGAISEAVPLGARVANAFVSLARYLRKTVWPTDLAVFYPHPGTWPAAAVVGAVFVALALTVLALLRWRREPWLAVGWFWFVGTLVPVIGLVQAGMQSLADRYTYIPLIGVLVAAVWFISEQMRRWPGGLRIGGGAGACVLLACSALTVRQLGVWRNSETLFTHAIAVTKDNFLAHNNLGAHYATLGHVDREIAEYRKSLTIKPGFLEALNNLASALCTQRQFAEALPLYERALTQVPGKVEIRINLANALQELGRFEEAIEQYQTALRLEPGNPAIHNQLGVTCAKLGQMDRAIQHFQEAIRQRPTDAEPQANLGNVYVLREDWPQAARAYARALELRPADAGPQYRLALVLLRMGDRSGAAERLREAVRLQPDFVEAARELHKLTGTAIQGR